MSNDEYIHISNTNMHVCVYTCVYVCIQLMRREKEAMNLTEIEEEMRGIWEGVKGGRRAEIV